MIEIPFDDSGFTMIAGKEFIQFPIGEFAAEGIWFLDKKQTWTLQSFSDDADRFMRNTRGPNFIPRKERKRLQTLFYILLSEISVLSMWFTWYLTKLPRLHCLCIWIMFEKFKYCIKNNNGWFALQNWILINVSAEWEMFFFLMMLLLFCYYQY